MNLNLMILIIYKISKSIYFLIIWNYYFFEILYKLYNIFINNIFNII